MTEPATIRVGDALDVRAVDGSDVTVLLTLEGGSMAHFALEAGRFSRAIEHRTVSEIWFVLAGRGEMWRGAGSAGAEESIVSLEPGVCLTIPVGTRFLPCSGRRAARRRCRHDAALARRRRGDPGRWPPGLDGGVGAVRAAVLVATILLVAGCSLAPALNPLATPWGDRVPDPALDAVAAQPVVTTGPGTVTVLPISPEGAAVGKGYGFALGHCGVDSPIDVDGSFWDPVTEPSGSAFFNATSGVFRLVTDTEAVFIASGGELLALSRHVGAKEFRLCE